MVVDGSRTLGGRQLAPGAAVRRRPGARLELGDQLVDRSSPVDVIVVPGVEHLGEDPLRPSVELGIGGRHTAPGIVCQAESAQLASVGGDVLIGRDLRVLAGFDGELLGGQAEGVEAHRVQHVVAGHPLEAGEHVGADETERVPNMQSAARRVREHVEHEQLLAALGGQLGVGQRAGGVRRLERVVLVPPVLPAQFDVLGERSVVAVGGCVGAGRWGSGHVVHTGRPA